MPVLWNAPPLLLGPAIAAPMVYAVLRWVIARAAGLDDAALLAVLRARQGRSHK